VVNKILKYENGIEDEINSILPSHNLPKIKINTFEKKHRPEGITYLDIFSKSQIETIYKTWEWEFLTFGYKK
jgi:hypothetical protein